MIIVHKSYRSADWGHVNLMYGYYLNIKHAG